MAALDRELEPILDRMTVSEHAESEAMTYWLGSFAGQSLAAVRTGVGPANARAAAEAAVARLRPSLIVSIGYAGGLVDSLGSASLVVGIGAIRDGERIELPRDEAQRAAELAAGLGIPHERGWLLTVDAPLITPESKRAAHADCGAIAVEMETAEVADVARRAGVACVAIRAISDTAAQSLQVCGKCVVSRRGLASLAKIGVHLLRRPMLAPLAWRLHRQGGQCSQRLAAVVEALLRERSQAG